MTLTYYNNASDTRTINKSISEVMTASGELYGISDILKPVLKVKQYAGNYVYIQEFDRYYYISDVSIEKGFYYISCTVDVLYTYRSTINNSIQTAVRSESTGSTLIPDQSYQLNSRNDNIIQQFGSGLPFAESSLTSTNKTFLIGVKAT